MRRVRRKAANKEKVFGCDLLEHLNASSQEIPQVLRCCSEFVETHGIVDGIYRLSGVSSNIQKLRTDFESDGTPDLNKDVYLQDIHCVSSLCKAYFRELPNPLLTYQLYDKFAEAVAIQLEEERLVKIRDVLKELPSPHYRTLEYLMHHLVRMASFSAETNMHARNLAIVWAPNLLRSKEIEASGFNGTAVFKEVRVQSIVVEFILTHVPQLFPEQGASQQRRKSLPSPATESNQDEDPFKFPRTQAVLNFGNICPGDAPLPMRPYHAIIEGTDKRKGSLKGRKWMSIFNIGSRFHDPLRRHKHSAKEKDRNVLRPARSMDSLSTPSYPNEGSRHASQHPPNKSSPPVTPSAQPGSDTNAFMGAIGGSEYAVTYRRGTGVVSGSAGNQGTSSAVDLEGFKSTNHETFQGRSSGDAAKMSRRAAMHITGPTLVTVPLHITTNLAFGVLQREGGERIVHYGRDKDGKSNVPDQEKAEEMDIRNEEGEKNDKAVSMDETEDAEACGRTERESKGKKERQEDCGYKAEMATAQWSRNPTEILASDSEEAKAVTGDTDNDDANEYMVMKSADADFEPEPNQESASNIPDHLSLPEVEEDDLTLSGYVEDSFEFLDHMDCSVLDHMDCSVPFQVHEFSVEPPGHSDDEYEVMQQGHPSLEPVENQTCTPTPMPETESHRVLTVNTHSRHIKSLSLPYATSPIHGPEESGSDDDDDDDDNAGDYYSSEDDESMFVKSLPSDFFLKELSESEPEIERWDKYAPEVGPAHVRITEDTAFERSACLEPPGDPKQVDAKDGEVNEGWEENELSRREDEDTIHQEPTHLENKGQRSAAGEDSSAVDDPQSRDSKQQPLKAEASPHHCSQYPASADEEAGDAADATVNKEEKVVDCSDGNDAQSWGSENAEVLFEEAKDLSEGASEPADREDRDKEERHGYRETEDVFQDVLKTSENDERIWTMVADLEAEEQTEENGDIWDDRADVPDEITKQEEDMQGEIKSAGQRDAAEEVGLKTAKVEFKDGEASERDVRTDAEMEPRPGKKLEEAEIQLKAEEKGAALGKTEELETDQRCVTTAARWSQDRREEFPADKERIECDGGMRAVGKKLVISKHPKVHQVKAVPVVPPKPQHCRITALTFRQQQQQQQEQQQTPSVRDRPDSDRGKEATTKAEMRQDDVCEGEREKDGDKGGREREKPKLRGGEREGGVDLRRNSPLSMCFDEAVAIATMRREKEKEHEKERQRDWGNEMQ